MTKRKENCSKLLPPPAWIRAFSFFVKCPVTSFQSFHRMWARGKHKHSSGWTWVTFPSPLPAPKYWTDISRYILQLKNSRYSKTYINKPALQLDHALSKPYVPYLFDLPPWALIKLLDLESWRLFEVGAYSRLGVY